MLVVSIIAPGAMGAGVGRRLVEQGVEVRTWLEGRGPASRIRAEEAGMRAVGLSEIVDADLILSIVPPGEAVGLAERLAPALLQANRKPVYVDCNAISPQTALHIEAIIAATGTAFVDGGIIGLPPEPGGKAPVFYVAGAAAEKAMALDGHGIPTRRLTGPVGAASGLKMSYAGITKGTTALAAAMMLAATRFGAADDLRAELAASQPATLANLRRNIPGMFPKAYRWVAEMQEIADFAGEDDATRQVYIGIARLYERLARDLEGSNTEIDALRAFVDG